MKKSLGASFVCFLLAAAALPLSAAYINREKERVVITETAVFGDSRAAEGITLQYATHWQGKLLWNTAYAVGSGKGAESRFTFVSSGRTWESPGVESVECYGASGWGIGGNKIHMEDLSRIHLPEAVKEVASRTAPGEKRTERIDLSDYYEYEPLSFFFQSGPKNVYYSEGDEPEEADSYPLSEYFAIPVEENTMLELTVEKDGQGNCIQIDCHDTEESGLWVNCRYAFGEEGCFLAYCCERKSGGPSVSGERYGIFYLPYVESAVRRTLDPRRIQKLCDLPGTVEPVEMELDEERGILYLVSLEDEIYSLSIYRMEDGKLLPVQDLPVFSLRAAEEKYAAEGYEERYPYWAGMWPEEAGVLLTWRDGFFAFVAEEAGRYSLFCQDMFPDCIRSDEGAMFDREQECLFPFEPVCAFDGERLALAALNEGWNGINASLAVYGEEGLRYYGFYDNSGSRESGEAYSYRAVRPQGAFNGLDARPERPLRINFQ